MSNFDHLIIDHMGSIWIALLILVPIGILLFPLSVKFEKEKKEREEARLRERRVRDFLRESQEDTEEDEEKDEDPPYSYSDKEYLDLTSGEPRFRKS